MQLMVIVQSFTSLRRGVRQLRRDVLGVAVASTTHGGWQAAGASVSSVEHAGDDGLARVILEPHILHCASSGVSLAVASCTRNRGVQSAHIIILAYLPNFYLSSTLPRLPSGCPVSLTPEFGFVSRVLLMALEFYGRLFV